MTKIYTRKDMNLDLVRGRTISVIGYGNQGRSQALNLRDSGLNVTVGNIEDEYAEQAAEDGFDVHCIEAAAAKGDVVHVLLPDEVAPQVYSRDIHGGLAKDNALCFSSGYNITYGYIRPPKFIDLILVAPRMGGADVRARFLDGSGFLSLVGAEQDGSGQALPIAIAIALGVGSTQGALMSSFREETIVDLFGEQLQGMGLFTAQLAFETLVEAGCSPEASLLELYMSQEVADDWRNCARSGLWKQLRGHSTTSQYGQLTRGASAAGKQTRELFKKIVSDIQSGAFASEWMQEQKKEFPLFQKLTKQSLSHPINKAEDDVRRILNR